MRRWLKRGLIVLAILVLALILFGAGVGILYRSTPDWYTAPVAPERISDAAQQAETKLTETTNWAAMLNGDAVRASRAQQSGRRAPATRVSDDYEIRFTQEELNALFAKWSSLYHWPSKYSQWLENPRIVLRENRLILAAQVKDLGTVASFHFAPRLDENHDLHLDLKRVMGGRLPLPDLLWDSQKEKVLAGLRRWIPTWQTAAALDAHGAANEHAVFVALGRLILHAANHEPAAPILFLPLVENSKSVPVKITDLGIEDDVLYLHVRRLTPAESAALDQSIHLPAR